jgi:hypothetical protein
MAAGLFLFLGLSLFSLLIGLSPAPVWALAVCPAIELVTGTLRRLTAQANDDQVHVYIVVAVVFAGIALLFGVAGRLFRIWLSDKKAGK